MLNIDITYGNRVLGIKSLRKFQYFHVFTVFKINTHQCFCDYHTLSIFKGALKIEFKTSLVIEFWKCSKMHFLILPQEFWLLSLSFYRFCLLKLDEVESKEEKPFTMLYHFPRKARQGKVAFKFVHFKNSFFFWVVQSSFVNFVIYFKMKFVQSAYKLHTMKITADS